MDSVGRFTFVGGGGGRIAPRLQRATAPDLTWPGSSPVDWGDRHRIGADDEVEVVAHHRVGEDIDGEGASGGSDGVAHPVGAVHDVIAAGEGAADAAEETVEAASSVIVDEVIAGYGQGLLIGS